jgi:hypothetical protein
MSSSQGKTGTGGFATATAIAAKITAALKKTETESEIFAVLLPLSLL